MLGSAKEPSTWKGCTELFGIAPESGRLAAITTDLLLEQKRGIIDLDAERTCPLSRSGSPTLRLRGLLGVAEPILTAGGRAVEHFSEVLVGIDVAKMRNAIVAGDGERGGEVRFFGEVTRRKKACAGW